MRLGWAGAVDQRWGFRDKAGRQREDTWGQRGQGEDVLGQGVTGAVSTQRPGPELGQHRLEAAARNSGPEHSLPWGLLCIRMRPLPCQR